MLSECNGLKVQAVIALITVFIFGATACSSPGERRAIEPDQITKLIERLADTPSSYDLRTQAEYSIRGVKPIYNHGEFFCEASGRCIKHSDIERIVVKSNPGPASRAFDAVAGAAFESALKLVLCSERPCGNADDPDAPPPPVFVRDEVLFLTLYTHNFPGAEYACTSEPMDALLRSSNSMEDLLGAIWEHRYQISGSCLVNFAAILNQTEPSKAYQMWHLGSVREKWEQLGCNNYVDQNWGKRDRYRLERSRGEKKENSARPLTHNFQSGSPHPVLLRENFGLKSHRELVGLINSKSAGFFDIQSTIVKDPKTYAYRPDIERICRLSGGAALDDVWRSRKPYLTTFDHFGTLHRIDLQGAEVVTDWKDK